MYLLYSAALASALLLASPYWLWQALRHGKYRAGLRERLGSVPARLRRTGPEENCVWIHAVSVGEVIAISPLVNTLRERLGEGWRIAVSTTTLTGQQLATQRFGKENVFYLPLDLPFALWSFFAAVRPRLLVLAETELWPNLLRLAHQSNAKVAVVNARISDRSLPRYKRFRVLLSKVLKNVDLFLAQSEMDQQRLIVIGAEPGRVLVSGNLKFEATPAKPADFINELRAAIPVEVPVLVCGSTVEGEESMLLQAFKRVAQRHPDALMILAPRHPERFAEVEQLLTSTCWRFWKRTEWRGEQLSGGVLLLDSIGELAAIYALASAAFVGGSLVPRGGHNILEPAGHGKPIFVGPHTYNFRDIIAIFQKADAIKVLDADRFEDDFTTAFDTKWQAMGERGREVLRSQMGARQRTVDALEVLLWMPSTIKPRYQLGPE